MSKQKKLNDLKKKMEIDNTLPLRNGATNLVFGDGSADAKIMFIGEGPGYWEDQKGIPFVGNAGAFLNQLLTSIGIPREDVYITNVIHFRPSGNRDPLPEELKAFEPYLDKIIEIIEPEIIITLGRISMAKFLPGARISSVHGRQRVVDFKGRKVLVIPMYHPAAGLRNTDIKKTTQNDFQKIPEIMKELADRVKEEAEERNKQVEQMSLV